MDNSRLVGEYALVKDRPRVVVVITQALEGDRVRVVSANPACGVWWDTDMSNLEIVEMRCTKCGFPIIEGGFHEV